MRYDMKDKSRIIALINEISSLLENGAVHPSKKALKSIETELIKIKGSIDIKPDTKPSNEIILIWSDGACKGNPGPGGWASIVQKDGESQEIYGSVRKTTNNIMELTAALQGIRLTPTGSQIVLTTDSKYLINGITEWIKNWKKKGWRKKDGSPVLNQELWQKLDAESQTRRIEWMWIKGHSGHPQNERCDQLANIAISELLI